VNDTLHGYLNDWVVNCGYYEHIVAPHYKLYSRYTCLAHYSVCDKMVYSKVYDYRYAVAQAAQCQQNTR
jgi:hypothetical protein